MTPRNPARHRAFRACLGLLTLLALSALPLAGQAAAQELIPAPEAVLINAPAGDLSVQTEVVTHTAEGGLVEDVSCAYQGDPELYVEIDTNTGQAPELLADGTAFDVTVNCSASIQGSYSGTLTCDYTAGGTAKSVETLLDCDIEAGPALQLETTVVKAGQLAAVPVRYVESPNVTASDTVIAFDAQVGLGEGTLPLPDLSNCGGTLGGVEVTCALNVNGGVDLRTQGPAGANLPSGDLGTIDFDLPGVVNVASSYELPVTFNPVGPQGTEPSALGVKSGWIHVTRNGEVTLAPGPSVGMAALTMVGPFVQDYQAPLTASTDLTAFGNVQALSCALSKGTTPIALGSLEATPLPPFVLSGTQQPFEVRCDARYPGLYADSVVCDYGSNKQVSIPVDCLVQHGPAIVLGNDQADPGGSATIDVGFVAGPRSVISFTATIPAPEFLLGAPDLSNCGGTLGDAVVSCSTDSSGSVILTAIAPDGPCSPPLPSGDLGSVTYPLPTPPDLVTPYVHEIAPSATFFDAQQLEIAAVGHEPGWVGCVCGGDSLILNEAGTPKLIEMIGSVGNQLLTGNISLTSTADLSNLSCGVASGGDPQISMVPPENPLPTELGAGQQLDLSARCLATQPGNFSANLECTYDSGSTQVAVTCQVDGGPAMRVGSDRTQAGGSASVPVEYVAGTGVTSFDVEVTYDANLLTVSDLSSCGGASALGVGVTCTDNSGVVRIQTDAAASSELPGGSLGTIGFTAGTPQEFPTNVDLGFNNEVYLDANNQQVEPLGSLQGEVVIEGPAIVTADVSSVSIGGAVGTDPTQVVTFTAQAEIQPGDLDCTLSGDPQLSAASSYPFTGETAPVLAAGQDFTVTFGCDTSATGTFDGTYTCVSYGDAGGGVQVELPVTCTVN